MPPLGPRVRSLDHVGIGLLPARIDASQGYKRGVTPEDLSGIVRPGGIDEMRRV